MSPCHNLEPSLVARDSSRLLSVKPNEWMHLSPFYTRMHGEWLRYAKSTSQFHWRFLLVRDVRGFQVNPLCRQDITRSDRLIGNCYFSLTELDIIKNLTAVDIKTSSVLLNRTKPNGQSSHYRVEYEDKNVIAENTSIKINNLIPGAQYTFRVFAVAADHVTEGRAN